MPDSSGFVRSSRFLGRPTAALATLMGRWLGVLIFAAVITCSAGVGPRAPAPGCRPRASGATSGMPPLPMPGLVGNGNGLGGASGGQGGGGIGDGGGGLGGGLGGINGTASSAAKPSGQ